MESISKSAKKIIETNMPKSMREKYKAGAPVIVSITRAKALQGYGNHMVVGLINSKIMSAGCTQQSSFGTPHTTILEYFLYGEKRYDYILEYKEVL